MLFPLAIANLKAAFFQSGFFYSLCDSFFAAVRIYLAPTRPARLIKIDLDT